LDGVDVLALVELIDGVVAILQADPSEDALGRVEVGGTRRGQQLLALEVLQRLDAGIGAGDELFHPVFGILGVHGDKHCHAGLLDVGIEPSSITSTAETSIWLVISAATLGGPPISLVISGSMSTSLK